MKVVRESLNEDIIDQVRARRFGISDDSGNNYTVKGSTSTDSKWDILVYKSSVGMLGDQVIVKNPYDLSEYDDECRGVVVGDDLYIENGGMYVHTDIINILKGKGVIKDTEYWHLKLPNEFLTMQRDSEKSMMIGESNEEFNNLSRLYYKKYLDSINRKYKGRIIFKVEKIVL